ncbi:hypothetical protein NKOR_03525 [Candidatus Nitrosopumilus koreensis AR1]|uniref:DUF504 domain-containing protein n=1 Tax=Candidatus Nitrosopumilus koreensis AR1 TaxID=1229908 RepID=K0B565_9ARCH|nr:MULTISPECIES: DUF504 domain-containing protein [Nitrosopumilus]AFS80599.1 hypothetical protein NKOR_03525 [Candidatus Nitrosopumilus koreensis AR1]
MVKKGIIEEIFSKAMYADDAKTYKIFYRNFNRTIETTLPEFLIQSDDNQIIPISRIQKIEKNNTVLFEKKSVKSE